MVKSATESLSAFEDVDFSNPWGNLTLSTAGEAVPLEAVTLIQKYLNPRFPQETAAKLEKSDCLILNDAEQVIAIATFTAALNYRAFDGYKGFKMGDFVVIPAYQKKGVGPFLAQKIIEIFNLQDQEAPINYTIGTDAGAALAAKIRDQIGDRLNVFDSR